MSSTSNGWVLGSSAAVVISRHLFQMISLIFAQYSPDRNVPHADCCIHPPGRNEMIAITPPKIFSKEVAQKQATPFPRQDLLTARNRFRPNFRGWRLDEFSIFARPPPGGLAHVRADDLEAFPSGLGHTASGTTYLPTR